MATETRKVSRRTYWILLGVGIILFLTFLGNVFREFFSVTGITAFIMSFGVYSFVVFSILFILMSFIPYGTTLMSVVGGVMYGSFNGFMIVFVLSIIGSLLPFYLARYLGKSWVERKLKESKLMKYAEPVNTNAFIVLFYVRLIPSIPYELQNYVAGVSKIGLKSYLLATTLGLGPIIFIHVYLGESLTAIGSQQFWIAVGIFILTLIAPLIVYAVRKKV